MVSAREPGAGGGGNDERAAAAWAERFRHDLRTPLAVISGMAETLEAAWDRLSAGDRAMMLATIRNQVARADALLDERLPRARREDPDGDGTG